MTMPDDPTAPLDPERIRSRTFSTARRGADPAEVQAFLRRVATEFATATERAADLQRQLDMLRSAPPEPTPDPLDPSNLTKLLGEETVRVLDAAQAAAAEIRARAEEGVARLLREAREEANEMRERAESLLAERTEVAEAEAARIREQTSVALERAEVEAAHIIEESKREGRALVMEAQQHRKRLLEDLAERQSQMREQIEQLQAGRDRLMAAYEAVRESVSSATRELQGAFPTAEEVAELDAAVEVPAIVAPVAEPVAEPAEPSSTTSPVGADVVIDLAASGAIDGSVDDSTDEAADATSSDPGASDEAVEATTDARPSPFTSPTGTVTLIRPVPAPAPEPSAPEASTSEPVTSESTDADEGASTDATDDEADGTDDGSATSTAPTPSSAPTVVTPSGPIRSAALPTAQREPVERPAPPKPAAPTEPKIVEAPKPERPPADPRPQGSSVRVVRASSGKVSDVFERLRQEGAEEEAQRAADAAAADATSAAAPATSSTAKADETSAAAATDAATTEDPDGAEAKPDAVQTLIVKRDDAVAQAQAGLSRRIKRELSDQQNEMLAALASVRGTVTAHDVLPMPEDHLERYDDIALPVLSEAADAGAALGRGRRNCARSSVADISAALASAVVMPLRSRLDAAVAESGRDRDALAKAIRTAFREWKGNVDDSVALHVATAVNRGLLDSTPKGSTVRWALADGDEPGPDCLENSRAGSVACGSAFPSGLIVPPTSPGCRCIVVPD